MIYFGLVVHGELYFVDIYRIQQKRDQLNKRCIVSIKKGNAEGTHTNRRTHDRAYKRFCGEYWFEPYPTSEWRLVQFAQYLFSENKK